MFYENLVIIILVLTMGLNYVLNGWLKLLIVVLARKWVVLLTNYKWAVVNSIRIQKWVVYSYQSQMGYKFSATHSWAH